MERYMKITGKAVIEYGLSENDFFIHDDACLLCGSLGVNKNKIDEMLRRINGFEAQQQEIERLNKVLDDWKYNAKCDADHIAGLLADKDEQGRRIMRMEDGLKKTRETLNIAIEHVCPTFRKAPNVCCCKLCPSLKVIDALLGGKEDV